MTFGGELGPWPSLDEAKQLGAQTAAIFRLE